MAFYCYYFKKLNCYLFEGDANHVILYETYRIDQQKLYMTSSRNDKRGPRTGFYLELSWPFFYYIDFKAVP
jgi:hypothetical protein